MPLCALKSQLSSSLRHVIVPFASLCAGVVLATGYAFANERPTPIRPNEPQLQAIVSDLKTRLAIPEDVRVAIVPTNALMMSVEPPAERTGVFRLAIEGAFLDALTPDEIEAAIAHELGHVWVFTHHPYLQTEQLANQIAMRVVSRASLERVYEKVWKRVGTKGDLVRFLGPQPVAGLAAD